jgi:molybdopterin synthase catalytic subunit
MKWPSFHRSQGVEVKIELREAPFNPLEALADYQAGLLELRGKYGATAVFIGTLRDVNEGDSIQSMRLEHYPGMTEQHLQDIVAAAYAQWDFLDALLIHRVGMLYPNDPIVLVAVWSAHRAAAFEACRFIVEALKSRAPFWKKESLADGSQRWVEKNTPG